MIKTALQIKTIGSILKEKRKEKKLELKDVSTEIKIGIHYLQALEDGNYTKFPSEVYLKGFLKNYAKYLDVNTEKALAMYRRENERKQNDTIINIASKGKQGPKAITFTPNKIIAGIAILAIIMILIYLSTYIGKVVRVPKLEITSPVAITTEESGSYKTDANFITISGLADIGSTLTINEQELKLNNFEKFSQEFNLEEGQNEFDIKSESQFGRIKQIKLVVIKEAGSSEVVTPTPTALQIALDIEVIKADANISITVDGELRTDRLYKVGSTLEFTATNSIVLTTNKPTSLELSINGQINEIESNTTNWTITEGEIVQQ